MKGTIHACLVECIEDRYGEDALVRCYTAAGLPEDHRFSILADIDEQETLDFIGKAAETLNIPVSQLFDDFGEHWCCTYAPKRYPMYYKGVNSTKEMVTALDGIHDKVTKTVKNARPPRFAYDWKGDETLLLTYNSDRGLLDLFISLVKGLDKHFSCSTSMNKLSDSQLELTFA